MSVLPKSARAVVESGHLAHVVTLNADGSPQVSCTWIAMDGEELVMMHTADHVKVRNLRRDPRVAISIESEEHSKGGTHPPFQFYLVIYGRATIVDGVAPDFAPMICANYGCEALPNVPPGFVTRVTVDRVGGVGQWVQR